MEILLYTQILYPENFSPLALLLQKNFDFFGRGIWLVDEKARIWVSKSEFKATREATFEIQNFNLNLNVGT